MFFHHKAGFFNIDSKPTKKLFESTIFEKLIYIIINVKTEYSRYVIQIRLSSLRKIDFYLLLTLFD